ncbi:4Fe-4S dicluster domain-containing protein [Desulfosediminicola ganghwensis]|uniref:4Fe-4S dicluster domain-containing protein n=1 Tax=Desulfosediminicola ganghwensis TaxID=2569540 RepID=UPI0010AD3387|nr:4Fe-4S dicluster domain-containing protein [Desulfosediminicola ganghwensis]
MNFNILLTLAVLTCLVGLALRLYAWFSQGIHPPSFSISPFQRLTWALQAVVATLFSGKVISLIKSIFTDLLFQKRIMQKSLLRWTAHSLIFAGFILLLLMHAMESVISANLFTNYVSTLNPYLFLRNLFGVMVIAGIGIAVFRRITLKSKRLISYNSDWAALILVGVIILSGMLLEGSRISSYTVFQSMMEEYGAFDEAEAANVEAFWVAENGLVSPNISGQIPAAQIELGREANSFSCIECHASNSSAFASYSLKGITRPFAMILGDSTAVGLFYFLHVLFCLTFLAWLPFSKMFHIISAPVSLLSRSVVGPGAQELEENEGPGLANTLTSQMVGLSACTHCGSCSTECSSSMFFESFKNDFILPSEKMQFLKHLAAGNPIDPQTRKQLQEGLYVCTSCDRCTEICPSGINLKGIFINARYALLEDGIPEKTLISHFSFPLALAQRYPDSHLKALKAVEEIFRRTFQKLTDLALPLSLSPAGGMLNDSYKSCYSCQRCTNICPVVRSYSNPVESLDMLPHQLIYSLGIGNSEVAMGSQMIWSCSTCYLCQEHCPNQVELTDIFYNLKNAALKKIDSGERS